MSKNGKTAKVLLGLTVAGAGVVGAWTLASVLDGRAEADAAKHAVNQIWIERLPTDGRDMIGHFVLVEHPRMRIGGIGKSSQWRHFVELFQWGLEGDRLSVYLPQDDVKAKLQVKTWKCAGEAPEPFELCMKLTSGKRTAMFYSRTDWVIEPHDVEGSLADIAESTPELAGVLAELGVDEDAEPLAVPEDAVEIDLLPRTGEP
jgi:hypothetical protein